MRISQKEIQQYKLPQQAEGAYFKLQYGKVGGELLCKQCGVFLDEGSWEEEHPHFDAKRKCICWNCGVEDQIVVKGATLTGNTYGMLVMPDGYTYFAEARTNPKDRFNKKLAREIIFGRLRKKITQQL